MTPAPGGPTGSPNGRADPGGDERGSRGDPPGLLIEAGRRDALRRRIDDRADALRDLPWRRTRDPWAILVAETMLQQTQVARVVPRWETFLARWPDPAAAAAAPVADVIAAWDGLGYNRRAVNLHGAATAIVDEHAGRVPSALDDLVALPGVGPYTARAVAVFAFEQPEAVVDSNVARLLARAVAGRSLGRRELQAHADALVPPATPWRHNQAIMEVGARTCTKRAPRCDACCLQDLCAWQEVGGPDALDDPAITTAGVANRQSRFAGSDRQGRGRLVRVLRHRPVAVAEVADLVGWDNPERVAMMVAGLVDDRLVERDRDQLRLPR
ncbi:MAG TPA: A/G-specific adenine glycosylase [Nitriliruptoraceae bacterium]|nr:A/G-specific adenine glycosylase [Nitriliruptoraceae bacterium]